MTRPTIVHIITKLESGGAGARAHNAALPKDRYRVVLAYGPGGYLVPAQIWLMSSCGPSPLWSVNRPDRRPSGAYGTQASLKHSRILRSSYKPIPRRPVSSADSVNPERRPGTHHRTVLDFMPETPRSPKVF